MKLTLTLLILLWKPEGREFSPNSVKQLPECARPNREIINPASSKGEKFAQLCLPRKAKYQKVGIRRSQRIQNTIVSVHSRHIEPLIEEIADSDSDREEVRVPEQHASDEEELPETTFVEKSVEDKIDFIVKLLETQEKNTEETVKFKVFLCLTYVHILFLLSWILYDIDIVPASCR